MNPLMWLFFFIGQWRQFCFAFLDCINFLSLEFREQLVMFSIWTFFTDSLASHDIFSLIKYVTYSLKDYFILHIKVWCFSPQPQLFLCNWTKTLWQGSWCLYCYLTCFSSIGFMILSPVMILSHAVSANSIQ